MIFGDTASRAYKSASATDWFAAAAPQGNSVPTSEDVSARKYQVQDRGSVDAFERGDPNVDAMFWSDSYYSLPSVTGVQVSQMTALQSSPVMSCVRMIVNDVAKALPSVLTLNTEGKKKVAEGHYLQEFFYEPNSWQTWQEFCQQMTLGLVLRGNGYAVIVRNFVGTPLYLVPLNPDRVVLWENPDGAISYMVTRCGLHETAMLQNEPLLIPSRDMLHLKGMSSNGLVGLSPIAMHRETIGLSLAQEQQAARWMGNGAKPSGLLTTDQKLTPEAAKRMGQDWVATKAGLANSGKTAVLEQGLKWQPLSMTSSDLEFIGSRRFQIEEIARIFNVTVAKFAEVASSGRVDPVVMQQQYVNNTLSDYTSIWENRLSKTFGLRKAGLYVDFDMSVFLKADMASRINMYRNAVMGGLVSQNEGREGIDREPKGLEADVLLTPSNSQPFGSDKSGSAPAGAGRPKNQGDEDADKPKASKD